MVDVEAGSSQTGLTFLESQYSAGECSFKARELDTRHRKLRIVETNPTGA